MKIIKFYLGVLYGEQEKILNDRSELNARKRLNQ